MESGLLDLFERYFLVILYNDDEDLQYKFKDINIAYKFYKKYENSKYNRQLFDITVVTEDIKNVYESK